MKNQFKIYLRITLGYLFGKHPKDFKKIPIIINNFNRLTTLKRLIHDLEIRGYHNIHIIDNKSDYQPLIDFYNNSDYIVYRLDKNIGFKALWKSRLWYKFMLGNYCYTDSDLSLCKECPDNFLEIFYAILKKYPKVHKVGFSLKIDDLPDYFDKKEEVINWESKYYENEKEPNLFIAPIDTTFALYRPFSKRGKRNGKDEILRVGFPYQCHHLPWYNDSKSLDAEEEYYINSVTKPTHWSNKK
jgi:hypothetical protein